MTRFGTALYDKVQARKLNVLDLFSGIGGFSLGLHRTGGFETVGFCEIDPYCRRVLAKNFPGVWIHDDIKTLTAELIAAHCGPIDAICGGFPCQDISQAGVGEGIKEGTRSGLWFEYARLIRQLQPRFAIMENVAGLLSNGLGIVLGNLAEIGYDAEWQSIPAAAVGAPHIRDRIWVLAYPRQKHGRTAWRFGAHGRPDELFSQGNYRSAAVGREDRELVALVPGIHPRVAQDWWRNQSRMDRSSHGVSCWMERCCALGNAVVPQVVEYIGCGILEAAE